MLQHPEQKIDVRGSLLMFFAFLFTVLSIGKDRPQEFIPYLALMVLVLFLIRNNPVSILKRISVLLPFVFLLILSIYLGSIVGGLLEHKTGNDFTSQGHLNKIKVIHVTLKMFLCVFALGILTATHSINHILKGAGQLGVPGIFLSLIASAYRYVFELKKELQTIRHSMLARGFQPLTLAGYKPFTGVLTALLLKSLSKSERMYLAMKSRGGPEGFCVVRNEPFPFSDRVITAGFIILVLGIRVAYVFV